MTRMWRAFLLILIVLVESAGTAFALAPMIQAVDQEQSAMPCHGDADTQATMPCCDEGEDCVCSASCLGAATTLIPFYARIESLPGAPFSVGVNQAVPLAAHPYPLLRPPAFSES